MSVIGPVDVLHPFGTLELQQVCADDLDVVNAAKVSFHRESSSVDDGGKALIGFLMREQHGSPFEHNFFKFRVRAPIAVAREWVRHRIGTSWNEESGRYVELRPHFYAPAEKDIRGQIGKPGAYIYEQLHGAAVSDGLAILTENYENTWYTYQALMDLGWAKELARYSLPLGLFTEWIWSCNARSLMAFLTLRNDPNAMLEIRAYASIMEDMFHEIMPVTGEWFRSMRVHNH